MLFLRKNIVSSQVVKTKSDRLVKHIMRDARKKIKKGELVDSRSFELYLRTIDARFTFLQSEINNATRVYNYSKIRAEKVAETRQLIDFFNQDYIELERLSQVVAKKAEEAQRLDDFKHEKLTAIDLTKLKNNFDRLTTEVKVDA